VNISFSKSAFEDLENIKVFYHDQGVPEIGENFVIAILKYIETLTDYPDIGRVVPEFNEKHIRELIHPPFRVVYLRSEALLNIVRIWRCERLLSLSEDEA